MTKHDGCQDGEDEERCQEAQLGLDVDDDGDREDDPEHAVEEGGALAAGHGLDQGRVLGEEAGEGARADVAQLEPGDLLPHHALEQPPPESGGEPLAGDTEHGSLQRGDNIYYINDQ